MKYIKGIAWSILLLILLVIVYAVINVWNIALPEAWQLSRETLNHIILTVGLIDLAVIALLIFIPFLFGNPAKGYNPKSGNVAQRKQEEQEGVRSDV